MSGGTRVANTNWAGNLTYRADRVVTPRSLEEAQELVAGASRVKALGSRHCFNDIADTPGGIQLDLAHAGVPIEIGAAGVTVAGAARYGDFAAQLHEAGFALPNLASLPHITVAGSVATGTHGSGERQPGLATAVSALELLTADGELRRFTRDGDPGVFPGLVVGLGGLGVVTRLTLDTVPAFAVRQDVYDRLPWAAAYEHFDEIQAAGYSVSMFTNWASDVVDQVWLKNVTGPGSTAPAGLFGAVPADGPRHPAQPAGVPADNCTAQQGVPGPWYDRLPHFRLEFTPSVGEELQTEYFVPRADAVAAFEALRGLSDRIAPLLLVSEIRTIAADELWLSPCTGGDRVALHFTWLPRQAEVEELLPLIEERLAPFGARPHWGKLFHGTGSADYPRLAEFRALARRLDPTGKFRTPFLDRHIFTEL